MRRLLVLLLVLFAAAVPICDAAASRPASASCRSPSTTSSIASTELDGDAVTTTLLVQFFDWLKGTRLDGGVARRPGRCGARHAAAARQGDPHHLR